MPFHHNIDIGVLLQHGDKLLHGCHTVGIHNVAPRFEHQPFVKRNVNLAILQLYAQPLALKTEQSIRNLSPECHHRRIFAGKYLL